MVRIASHTIHYLFEPSDSSIPELAVVNFSGHEGISQLMHFEIDLLGPTQPIDFETILNKPASFAIRCWPDFVFQRMYHGIISSFEQTGQTQEGISYRAELVPRLWRLTLNYQSRIFQDMSVPEIIEQVLTDSGLQSDDFRFSMQSTYEPINKPPREFCVQYRESDFNFISRLMEEEGIFYFFEYNDEREIMVIADSPSVHNEAIPRSDAQYEEPTGLPPMEEEKVFPLNLKESVLPSKVTLKDFNYDTPATSLLAASQINPATQMEVYDYPGRFGFTSRGSHLARVRNEEIIAGQKIISGKGNCRSFCTGYRFTLAGHPNLALNREYLLTKVSHEGVQGGMLAQDTPTRYENQFECIPSDVPYRPPCVTPKPRVQGTQTAIVVGPRNEEIYVDEKGRVKIQFHWDLDGEYNENSSCWVRVSQTWAGSGWGGMFIPRIGQEVVVDFLEGDPDQPLITGTVYNGDNRPPYPLPGERTKSTVKSNSSKGGDGFNEIRFEDKKGDEQIFIHAEKDVDFRAKNDRREWVGNDRHLVVKRDKREQVDRDKQIIIGRDEVQEIKRDHNLTIKGKEAIKVTGSRSITVQGDVIEAFRSNHSEQVTQDYYVKAMNVIIEGMTGLTIKVGGSFITLNSGGIFISGPIVNINSGGAALSGMAGRAVPPAAPMEAEIADTDKPGQEATYKSQRAQMSPSEAAALNAPWHKEPEEEEDEDEEKSWIEIELVDEEEQPIAGKRFQVILPDGSTLAQGTTDSNGLARVRGIDPGECKIVFPDIDKDGWEKI